MKKLTGGPAAWCKWGDKPPSLTV